MNGPGPCGGLMVCGTGSDSGKSTVVAGLCRLLARRGVRVAPFKAQNMALNSAVTPAGHEIGRAQAAQAAAAGVPPDVAMNPILLKPSDHRTSQVVVLGRPWRTMDAAAYQEAKEELWPVVVEQLWLLRSRFDAVICEGAGSPAEINLLERDITNLRVAEAAGFPALLVGDIDRGGVFASLFGTVSILPPALAGLVRGFVINKFRGDPELLTPGLAELERRTGVPTVGVLPWMDSLALDAEDSLALARYAPPEAPDAGAIDVAAVRLPRISNFTDLDAFALEPGVRLRLVDRPADLGSPDLVVLPGSKATVSDLEWLCAGGLAAALADLHARGRTTVLGVCGGYQMLGVRIDDRVEARSPTSVAGLGLLPVATTFDPVKVTRRVSGTALGQPVEGYEIHHGRTSGGDPWLTLGDGSEGARSEDGRVYGTSVHGLMENDAFRRAFLHDVARRSGADWQPGPQVCFAEARSRQFDRLADALEAHLDMQAVHTLLKAAGS
ncbi:MAG TPA: cobyric acid synthase [Acidimicrobiales bacterium]|nr:cobyric acid synthase [Acidimicrobiales bacterium]